MFDMYKQYWITNEKLEKEKTIEQQCIEIAKTTVSPRWAEDAETPIKKER